jgi:hypothetical protein
MGTGATRDFLISTPFSASDTTGWVASHDLVANMLRAGDRPLPPEHHSTTCCFTDRRPLDRNAGLIETLRRHSHKDFHGTRWRQWEHPGTEAPAIPASTPATALHPHVSRHPLLVFGDDSSISERTRLACAPPVGESNTEPRHSAWLTTDVHHAAAFMGRMGVKENGGVDDESVRIDLQGFDTDCDLVCPVNESINRHRCGQSTFGGPVPGRGSPLVRSLRLGGGKGLEKGHRGKGSPAGLRLFRNDGGEAAVYRVCHLACALGAVGLTEVVVGEDHENCAEKLTCP